MFAVGTTLTFGDLRRVLRRPRAFFLGVFAHALLLPALAFGVAVALALPPPIAVGLVLIASCPANASANVLAHLGRGDTMLSVCLTAAASLTSVVTVPVFVSAALAVFGGSGAVRMPVLSSALGLFLVSTAPVLAGMRLRQTRPDAARGIETRLGVLGLVVIVVVIAAAVWSVRSEVLGALLRAGGPAILTNALAVAATWALSALLGLSRPQRVAVGLECGLQNFAMATFVALTLMRKPDLLLPGIAYGLTMWLSATLVVLVSRRAAAAASDPRPSSSIA